MKKLLFYLLFLLLLISGSVCGAEDITSKTQLNEPGMIVGVSQGSVIESAVSMELPNAAIAYFTDNFMGYESVANGKIDAFIYDQRQMEMALKNGLKGVRLLDEPMDKTVEIAVGLSDVSAIPDLKGKINLFIAEKKADGTLDEMYRRWVLDGNETMPVIELSAEPAYHLTVGTAGTVPPYSYYEGTELKGYDIELAYRFAIWLNADLQLSIYDFDGIIPAAVAGKIDCIMSNLEIDDERVENFSFSDPLFEQKYAIMVRGNDSQDASTSTEAPLWQEYNGKRLGVLVGPLMEDAAHEYFPDSEYLLFNSYPDCIAALLSGKIDAYLGDEPSMKTLHAEQPEIDYIHERITQNNYSFAFRKNDPQSAALCDELNEFLSRCWNDGTMRELDDIWFGIDEERKVVDMSGLTGENGIIRVVTTSSDMPFSYIKDGKNVGYDIDLVVRFCRDRGYELELGDVDFAGRIPAIESGKYDFTTDMNVTPEREEQVLFSEPTSYGGIVLAVLSQQNQDVTTSFWESIHSSFEKTFIRENRWQLILKGIANTLLITFLSVIFGTGLGFLLFMLCRNGHPIANNVTNFCLWIVEGMPMVVLLMVLFYVIFGKVKIDGIVIAVIGFTLTFGGSVFGLLKIGVGAVDSGQYDAAYALGYSNRKAFFRMILPQAVPHVINAWKSEIISLLKATAVVGYIAVQDLTKMGDIIRSRTYEAFFPLIAVTVIYFILEALLGQLINRIQIQTDPKRRKPEDILKGIRV